MFLVVFVFGEHSDWAGQYRQLNPDLNPGRAIVTGINQGIYARVETYSHLSFKTLHSARVLEIPMTANTVQQQV